MSTTVAITDHTTASNPRPHVVYRVEVTCAHGSKTTVNKRYSDVSYHYSLPFSRVPYANLIVQFVELHSQLDDPLSLPPKRILATTFLPSAWVDNALISERKLGLSAYLNGLLSSSPFRNSPALATFLKTSSTATTGEFSLEDALPSTLTRAAALNVQKQLAKSGEGEVKAAATPIAAAYYPDWSADSIPPESLDYSRFDVLFFGSCLLPFLSTQADGLAAFATPNSSNGLSWDDGATSILQRLVKSARNSGKGTKIVLSIGMFSLKCLCTESPHIFH